MSCDTTANCSQSEMMIFGDVRWPKLEDEVRPGSKRRPIDFDRVRLECRSSLEKNNVVSLWSVISKRITD